MRTRLLLVIVGTVVLIMVAAGAGTWLLAAQSTRNDAITQVLASAKSFAAIGSGEISIGVPKIKSRAIQKAIVTAELQKLEQLLHLTSKLDGANFLPAAVPSDLHSPVVPSSILNSLADSTAVGSSTAVAGSTGSVAWAAEVVGLHVEVTRANGTSASISRRYVLVLRRDIGKPSVSGYFLILAGAVVAFAVVVTLALTRRLTGPLRRAVATTERIAAGDLDARVGAQPGDFPELTALANAIDAMAGSLGRLRAAERQFLLSVSHELRTPLTSIRGYSEAILDGTAVDPSHAAAVIGNESRRLERLVGDLLDLAKLDARTFSFNFRTVDVGEVVEEVAEELRPVAAGAGLELQVHPPEHAVFARVDPDRLDQVLANLVENAAKYAANQHHPRHGRERIGGTPRRTGRRPGHRARRDRPDLRAALQRRSACPTRPAPRVGPGSRHCFGALGSHGSDGPCRVADRPGRRHPDDRPAADRRSGPRGRADFGSSSRPRRDSQVRTHDVGCALYKSLTSPERAPDPRVAH